MKLTIHRKKKFASALVPFFIMLSDSKDQFVNKYRLLNDDHCELARSGHPVPREDSAPAEYSIPIKNGETLELEIGEEIHSVFAITYEGLVSNEVVFDKPLESANISITVRGGWSKPSYPVLVQDHG